MLPVRASVPLEVFVRVAADLASAVLPAEVLAASFDIVEVREGTVLTDLDAAVLFKTDLSVVLAPLSEV